MPATATALRPCPKVSAKTCERLFVVAARAPDPVYRPAFEAAPSDLPAGDAERVLARALVALTRAALEPSASSG